MKDPLILAAIVLAITARVSSAQEFRGTILGRVTDPQGAALPHVPVLVTSEETSVSAEATTQADGAYSVAFLNPGKYRVEVSLTGFKTFVQSGITVGVTQHVTVDVKVIAVPGSCGGAVPAMSVGVTQRASRKSMRE